MSDGTPRERAFKSGQEAAARAAEGVAALERRRGRPIEPGDLCALPEAASSADTDHPAVEWAVLERDPADPRRLLAVPADTFPPVGAADVELPGGEAAGPLRLRCRYALWAEERVFARALRTGVLPPRVRRAAGEVCEALAEGTLRPSSLGEEAEADPEYRDWEREALAPARDVLTRRSAGLPALDGAGSAVERRRWAPSRSAQLAAVFFFATVGLAVWAGFLRWQLAMPITVGDKESPVAFGVRGGADPVTVPPGVTHLLLKFLDTEAPRFRVEILNTKDRKVWTSRSREIAEGETFGVPRSDLPDGLYTVVLRDRSGKELTRHEIQVGPPSP